MPSTSHDYQTFGDLLRHHRVFAGMSQEELAERAGLSARAISDLERGVKRAPRRDTLQLLLEALRLTGEEREIFVAAARVVAAHPHAKPIGKPIPAREETGGQSATDLKIPASRAFRSTTTLPSGGFLGATPEGPLVGRQHEYDAIQHALDTVSAGSGRLLMIGGEPGVGKTRLAQEAMLACHERGFLVATGRCYEPHRDVPYYPFLEVLSSLYAATSESLRQEINERWPALLGLLPEYQVPTLPARGASPQEEQQRLFWAVTGFIHALSQVSPIAFLLDDVHWADDASLALLQHLARRSHANAVLLLGTYRDVGVNRQHPLGKALHDLEREHLVDRIAVLRLSHDETARLIATRLGQDVSGEFNNLLHEHTDGNPLFVREVLRALIERGDVYRRDGRWERKEITAIDVPESVRATIADRVSRLAEPAQDALREASVLGQAFTFDDLRAMGGHTEDVLDAAIEEAIAAGLVQETREGYVFNHALTQQTLYTELSSRRRKRLHLAAAEAIERLPERARRRRAAELAWHFREAGATGPAVSYSLLAGENAQSLYAMREAERHFRAGIELAESADDRVGVAQALEKLGWLMWLSAHFDVSAETLERAADEYRSLGDVEGEMRTVGRLGMLYYATDPLEGVRRTTALLDRLGQSESSRSLASLYVSLALNLLILGRYSETEAAAERGAEMARALGDTRTEIWAEATRGPALGLMGQLRESRRIGDEALPVAVATGDSYSVLSVVHYLGAICVALGDFPAAEEHYFRALELAERLGAQSRMSAESANLAEVLFYQGRWERARDLVERALKIAREESSSRSGSFFQFAHVFRQAGMIHAATGEWEEARVLLEEAVAFAKRLPYPEALRGSQALLAEHALLSGDHDAALARLEPLMEGSDMGELGIARLLPTLAQAYAELGDFADAERLLAEGIERATAQGHRLALVDLFRARGATWALRGQNRWEEAERAFDDAIVLARESRYPYAEGRALHAQGLLYRGAKRWKAARERIEEALAIFRQLGARSDMRRAQQALAQLESV